MRCPNCSHYGTKGNFVMQVYTCFDEKGDVNVAMFCSECEYTWEARFDLEER